MVLSVFIAAESMPSATQEARWLAALPAVRAAELSRWADRAARSRSLLGTRLLAHGLRRFGFDAGALASLRHPPRAKPSLDLPLDFSISHSEGCVACVLSTAGPVGIDVEAVGRLTAGEFGRYLTPAERAWAGANSARFYALWTRKEAVAKAAGGRGLADVAQVTVDLVRMTATLHGRRWQTPAVPVGAGHVAHLAWLAHDGAAAASPPVEHVAPAALECDAPARCAAPRAAAGALVL